MVNENNEENTTIQQDDDLTYDNPELTDTELVDDEATADQKLKALRTKLQAATEKNRELHEEVQRAKADFLNARKRLEEDRIETRERDIVRHIENLLPLADSFYLAMYDRATWEKGDEKWRKGIEGIHNQLLGILRSYGVESFDPTGAAFDPARHDAMSTAPVTDAGQHDTVLSIMQQGYQRTIGDTSTIIRPARVIVGEFSN